MNRRELAIVSVVVLAAAAGCVGQGDQPDSSSGVLMVTPVEQPPETVDPVAFSSSPLADSAVVESAFERAQENGTLVSEGVNRSQVKTLQNQLSDVPTSATDGNEYYLSYDSQVCKVVLKVED